MSRYEEMKIIEDSYIDEAALIISEAGKLIIYYKIFYILINFNKIFKQLFNTIFKKYLWIKKGKIHEEKCSVMLRSPCDEWKRGDNSGFTILEIAEKGQSSEKLKFFMVICLKILKFFVNFRNNSNKFGEFLNFLGFSEISRKFEKIIKNT